MNRRTIAKLLGILTATVIVASCTDTVQPMMTDPPAPSLAQDTIWRRVMPTQVMVGLPGSAVPANTALENSARLKTALVTYLPEGASIPDNLGQLIRQIRSANPAALKGIGGVGGEMFLDAAKAALRGNGQFNAQTNVQMIMSGQILDFSFDSITGNGHITSATYIDTVVAGGTVMPRRETFVWQVTVTKDASEPNSGFSVRANEGGNDPFPGTIQFPPEMIPGINANFPFKLWAKGNSITVNNVWYRPNPNANFQYVDDHHRYKELRLSGPGNCIDMLFAATPPATLADLIAPPFYCLGRCDRPLLVNTGY